MIAVISDLHANLPALTAVLEDIEREGADRIICLGDVVGYGPDPEPCLELVRERAEVTLLGNHDEALMCEPHSFNKTAAEVVRWTREQIEGKTALWEFIADMLPIHEIGPDFFVHGSPCDPTQEYLMPNDPLSSPKYDDVFDEFERLLFVGHTHHPCVITSDRRLMRPEELDGEYLLDAEQAIINVGSVGQPRDRNTKACYVLVDDEHVQWRRVEYDVEATISRILELGLPQSLAKRLKNGK